MTAPTETPAGVSAAAESQRWLGQLGSSGASRDAAVAELHALLLRAARFEVDRRRASLPHLRGGDHEDLAQQSADDALVAVLGKLDQFRGESRFTTWAYKFALLEAAVKVRKRAWQGREVPLEEDAWATLLDSHDLGRPRRRRRRAASASCAMRSKMASAPASARCSLPWR